MEFSNSIHSEPRNDLSRIYAKTVLVSPIEHSPNFDGLFRRPPVLYKVLYELLYLACAFPTNCVYKDMESSNGFITAQIIEEEYRIRFSLATCLRQRVCQGRCSL